jgi:hypothetical protein
MTGGAKGKTFRGKSSSLRCVADDMDGGEATGTNDPPTTPTPLIDGALHSRDDETPWSVAWGKLPDGVDHVQVVFRNGRKTQPAARADVVGRHWAAEVAGRFDKVTVTGVGVRATAKVKTREKPGRRDRKKIASGDPLAQMKHHWGLAGLILQPGSHERPELPDIRSAGGG